ncbi:TPA: hypothetical protein OO086_002511 [Legionella pneumophila]|nr:hypothetical protein [Legionella pneumophila]
MTATRQLKIPADVAFSDLGLYRNAKGNIQFKIEIFEKICTSNEMPIDYFLKNDEQQAAELIVEWYIVHRQMGGEACACAEQLINEVLHENKAGQFTSYTAGNA